MKGVGAALAAVTGVLSLMVARCFASGDTLEPPAPVLVAKPWLATHETWDALGFGSTFVAGGLGIVYILRSLFGSGFDPEPLTRGTIRAQALATGFGAAGILLGGIWTEHAWGRFWGWDPKENGALILVLWNAAALVARNEGIIAERGVAMAAVFGNIVASWAWLGVHTLGVGLYSYDLRGAPAMWLMAFALSQLLIFGVGTALRLRLRRARS
jgi:hypothetical protein